ncbi:histidine kinase, partial [Clavibacter sp. MX14-G9D]|uniref:sensor histidine kinase n=1 Tax=Clavibacter sp. MX14-G9D TaxID=3064656 RepID=UPI00293E5BF2
VLRDLDAERRLALERATREERDGLARDLHDDLTNRLTGMVLQLQATRRALGADGGALDADLAAVEDAGGAALASMRAWVRTLRATDVERDAELSSTPTEGLAELLARWEATASGGRAELDDRTPADVPDDVRATAIRIVQEAVTNATRHAPGARWIRVALRAEGADLVVEVVSPRMVPGGDPVPGSPGLGLLGMRERAALVGGRLEAGPTAAGTWRVRLELPVEPVAGDARGDA